MDILQTFALVMITVILIQIFEKNEKQIGIVLVILCGCFVLSAAIKYLNPVFSFIEQIESLIFIDHDLFQIMLKIAGIGIITEVANLICIDSGNASLGKTMQLLGVSVILWLSIPLFSALIELLQEILGEL